MGDTGARQYELLPSNMKEAASNQLDVMRVVDMFRRRLWVVAMTAGLVFLLIAFLTASATKLYTATSQVEIDTRETRVLGGAADSVVAGLPANTQIVDTETQILASRTLAGRVVDTLNLIDDPEFAPPTKQ